MTGSSGAGTGWGGLGGEAFPRTLSALGAAERCLGATLRVLVSGRTVLDVAVGRTAAGGPLSSDATMPWFSASKLPATLAAARAWELGLLEPDDLVVDHLPEFRGPVKERITVRHLLTHTAPLRRVDRAVGAEFSAGRDRVIELILGGDVDPAWEPGRRAGYLGHAGYLLLDEIVARASGTSFAAFQASEVTGPLGLRSALGGAPGVAVQEVPWFGPPELADRVGRFDVAQGYPSACMAGPFGEAAALCELVRRGGIAGGRRILSPETCDALVTDQRPRELLDEAAGRPRRWGLGMMLDDESFGPASDRSFGALGGTACMVFSDPALELTVALHFNGNTLPGPERSHRDRRVLTALYSELRQHPPDRRDGVVSSTSRPHGTD